METNSISLKYGISRAPSVGTEGTLAECVNLVPKNGELVPLEEPKELGITIPDGYELEIAHTTSTYTHYILYKASEARLYWVDSTASGEVSPQVLPIGHFLENPMNQVLSVGNTIVVLSKEKKEYLLWKGDKYHYLGTAPELPEIEFYLVNGKPAKEDSFPDDYPTTGSVNSSGWSGGLAVDSYNKEITIPGFNYGYIAAKVVPDGSDLDSSTNRKLFSDGVWACVNTGYEYFAKSRGELIYPFFVRFAVEDYSGNVLKVSSPVLLTPSLYVPFVTRRLKVTVNGSNRYYSVVCMNPCKLYARLTSLGDLADWSDIVYRIRYYVSPQVPTLDYTEGTHMSYYSTSIADSEKNYGLFGVRKVSSSTTAEETIDHLNYRRFMWSILGTEKGFSLPLYSKAKIDDKLTQAQSFYYLSEHKVSVLEKMLKDSSTAYADYEVPDVKDRLSEIENQSQMPNDYFANNDLTAEGAYLYNGRVNMYRVKRDIFPGFSQFTSQQRVNETTQYYYDTYVYIRTTDGNVKVAHKQFRTDRIVGNWFYYPDDRAFKVIIKKSYYKGTVIGELTLSLTAHESWNGAYYFGGLPSTDTDNFTAVDDGVGTVIGDVDSTAEYFSNKVYTSNVDDPFTFPLGGINTIGTGSILNVCAATKALSQGQFGQFPLYAFCDDGIWALEVDAGTGLYQQIAPVSRDVCTNTDSVTPIDGAVAFVTKKGLMLLQGSEVGLLSVPMEGENIDESTFDVLASHSGLFVKDTDRFTEMLQSARLVYDYDHSLIHIFPSTETTKHFVYSLESREFSTYVGYDIRTSVLGYPHNIVQMNDGRLVTYAHNPSDEARKGLLITRGISFGDPFTLKNLGDLKMLYTRHSADSKCQIAVWVSNDGHNWARLTSLRSRAYKWYRFAVYTALGKDDALSGIVCLTESRRTNKLR